MTTLYTTGEVCRLLKRDRHWVRNRLRYREGIGTLIGPRTRVYTEEDLAELRTIAEREDNTPTIEQRVLEAHLRGFTREEIANVINVTTRTVSRILRRAEDANRNANMRG